MMILFTFYMELVQWMEKHLLSCPSKLLFRMDCPGCGLQRSYILLLRGDFKASFQMYPAAIPILLMVLFLLIHLKFRFSNGAKILTGLYIFCALIILVSYIFKILTHQNLT